jgi:hypothetical protein
MIVSQNSTIMNSSMKSLRLSAEMKNGSHITIGQEKQSFMVPQISAIMNSSMKSQGRWPSAKMIVSENSTIMNSSMKSLGLSAEIMNGHHITIGMKNNHLWFVKSAPS